MNVLIFVHLSFCLLMTGVIWIVQIVHYPTFRFIDNQKFTLFSAFHAKYISFIVMPLMLIEILTATILALQYPENKIIINLTLLIITWLFTFFISVPLHTKLQKERSPNSIEKLIISNWPRTILWTFRSLFLWIIAAEKLGVIQ